MTTADFRELALSFDGAAECAHMGAADFRVGGRIFATLAHGHLGLGNLMLSPELQRSLVDGDPDVFVPVAGGWGRMGSTHIRLAKATPEQLSRGLHLAWSLRAEQNGERKRNPKRRGGG